MDVELPWFSSPQVKTIKSRLLQWNIYQHAVGVLQRRSWNEGFMYMQSTSNSTTQGFNLPFNRVYVSAPWPRCTKSSSENAHQSETCLVHIIVGFWIGLTVHVSVILLTYTVKTLRNKLHSSKAESAQRSQRCEACALFVNVSKKITVREPIWHQKQVNSMRATYTADP